MGAGRRRVWWAYDECKHHVEENKSCSYCGKTEGDYGRFESEGSERGVSSKGHASRVNRAEV